MFFFEDECFFSLSSQVKLIRTCTSLSSFLGGIGAAHGCFLPKRTAGEKILHTSVEFSHWCVITKEKNFGN